MLALALLLAAGDVSAPRGQVLAGKPFEALVARTARICPGSPVRSASPAGLLDAEDTFVGHLGRPEQARVRRAIRRLADGTPRRCANSPGGASCPAGEELLAIQRAGLLPRFARAVCSSPGVWN